MTDHPQLDALLEHATVHTTEWDTKVLSLAYLSPALFSIVTNHPLLALTTFTGGIYAMWTDPLDVKTRTFQEIKLDADAKLYSDINNPFAYYHPANTTKLYTIAQGTQYDAPFTSTHTLYEVTRFETTEDVTNWLDTRTTTQTTSEEPITMYVGDIERWCTDNREYQYKWRKNNPNSRTVTPSSFPHSESTQ